MDSFLAVIHYTLKQHIRHRVYLSVILFGLILLVSGLIVSSLAVDEQLRMLLNIGLAGIEFLTLIAVVFLSVSLIIEEMETRSIYLVLSHPIERWQYILGRFSGTILALFMGVLIMVGLHLLSLFFKGWAWDTFYLVAILCSLIKIMIVGSLALLISLVTTSTATSMVVTFFLWVLGHFTSEMAFMAEKSGSVLVKGLIWVFQRVSPDFSYFNYRDFWHAFETPPTAWYGWMLVYAFCYMGAALLLSSWFFSKREF